MKTRNRNKSVLTLAAVALVSLASLSTAQAATVLIDWSTSASVANPGTHSNYWNSIGTDTSNLIDSSNVATTWDVGVSFATSAGFGGAGVNGPAGSDPFDEPNAVIDGIFSATDVAFATITFSDLTASTQYDFSAIGGRAGLGRDGIIAVTIGTGTAGDLLNDGTVLDFTITSTAAGTIAFTFAETAGGAGTIDSATFNAMSISEVAVPEPGAITLALMSLSAFGLMAIRRRRRNRR